MADKITFKNGNNSVSVYSSSKVDSLKSDTDSKISSINSRLSTIGTADNISALDKRLKSVEGDYLSKKGGNISGNLILKNGAYANGSRQADSNTIPALIDELRKGTGVNGSVSITTAYSLGGKTLPTGWYNFQWIPHRFGEGENDNSSYGNLIMFPMNFGGEYFYILRYSDGKIAALYKLNIDVNLSDYYKKAEVNSAFAKKSDIPTSLPASDVSAWAKASSKPSYSWSEISGKPTNFITSGNIGSQTVSKADSAGSANTASMISGFGTRNDNTGWGKLTAKNGYTIRFGSDQPGGGGTVFAEKDGRTYMQIDGTFFVNEGNQEVAVKSDIPAALPDVHGLHIGSKYFNGSASVTVYAHDLGTQVVDTQNASPQADAMSGAALNIYDYDGSIKDMRTFQFAAGIVDFPAGSNYRSKSVSFFGSGGNPFYGTSGTVKVVVSEVAKDGYSGSGSGELYNAVKAYGVSNYGFTIYCAPGDAVSVNWIAFKLS